MSEPEKRVIAIDLFGIMGLPVKDGEMPPVEFAITWDPAIVTPEQYAELVDILGDIVRANGAAGVRRVAESDVRLEGDSIAKGGYPGWPEDV